MFTNAKDAINWIEHIERVGEKRKDLSRMKLALEILGNPETDMNIIHVGGTNGKGSTVSFIKNILIEEGINVGAFISPYVVKFNERIQYNYSYISDADLVLYTNTVYQVNEILINEYDEHLTFFEVTTLVAICYFKAKEVCYAILEVGLGGLTDATNFCNAKCSIITNIGFDHMKQLGETKEAIALNKLGIVKEGNHLITTVDQELLPLFTKYVEENKATMEYINPKDIVIYPTEYTSFSYDMVDYDLSMVGFHQAYNAALAIACVKYLEPNISLKKIKNGLLNTTWPGRLEIVRKKPKVILDGAHNIHGIEALCKTIDEIYPNPIVVFACLFDKESSKMINMLKDHCEKVIITEIDYHRGKKASELFMEFDHRDKAIEPDYMKAIDLALSYHKTVIVTGSLYFISLARKYLLK